MIITWSSGIAAENMDEEILVGLSAIVSRHPGWAARTDLVLAMLGELRILPPASILEAGCGWGTNLQALEAEGYEVTGLDVSRRALERLDRPHRQLIEADLSLGLPVSVPSLPDLYSEFDAIQGHRRRYTAQSLRACLEGAGLVVEDLLWWGRWM